jgi:SET domain-containing protein
MARYANHSCAPNAEADLERGQIVLRAIRPIGTGEEITYDYGREYFELFIRPQGCHCERCATRRRKRNGKTPSSASRGKARGKRRSTTKP